MRERHVEAAVNEQHSGDLKGRAHDTAENAHKENEEDAADDLVLRQTEGREAPKKNGPQPGQQLPVQHRELEHKAKGGLETKETHSADALERRREGCKLRSTSGG